jgi:hypothetical protein
MWYVALFSNALLHTRTSRSNKLRTPKFSSSLMPRKPLRMPSNRLVMRLGTELRLPHSKKGLSLSKLEPLNSSKSKI